MRTLIIIYFTISILYLITTILGSLYATHVFKMAHPDFEPPHNPLIVRICALFRWAFVVFCPIVHTFFLLTTILCWQKTTDSAVEQMEYRWGFN